MTNPKRGGGQQPQADSSSSDVPEGATTEPQTGGGVAASPTQTPEGQATVEDNQKPEHSVEGVTTRDDALDSGAPMLPGSPEEPVGPEDALGSGPKRGDYSKLIGTQQFTASVPNPQYDPEDPSSPRSILVHQNPLVEQIGDDEGVKGGTKPLTDEVK